MQILTDSSEQFVLEEWHFISNSWLGNYYTLLGFLLYLYGL